MQDYASRGSERAFGELVARHIDMVYSVALRLVRGDVHLAQDVAQTVFADLSLKAKSLAGGAVLAGWLCRHTFFVASAKVRTEQRRRQRERQAVQMNTLHQSTEPDWEQLTPILDQVLQELGSQDRNAIVLRYFKRQSLESVGAALGINPDAAHWSQVEPSDYRQYIANLRAIGCPEQTIRDLVTFRVCRSCHERLLEAERQRIISRDPTRSGSANSGNVRRDQLLGLRNARDRELEALFGVSASKLTESVFVFLDHPKPSETDDPLPLDKRAQVRDIEERYRRLIVEAQHGLAFNGPDASVDAAIGELNRQKEAELASALSPRELDALRLRESPAARYVLKGRLRQLLGEPRMAELELEDADPAAAGKPIQHSGLQMTCTVNGWRRADLARAQPSAAGCLTPGSGWPRGPLHYWAACIWCRWFGPRSSPPPFPGSGR